MTLKVGHSVLRDVVFASADSFTRMELVRNYRLYLTLSSASSQEETRTFTAGEFSKEDWLSLLTFASSVHPLASLKVFRLTESDFFTEAEMSVFIGKMPHVEELELTESDQVTDALLAQIGKRCPRLRKLNLSFCSQVSDRGLASLASCEKLISLSVAACPQVTDKGVSAFINLMHLNVMGTNVSDAWPCRDLETLLAGKSDKGISRFARQDLSSLRKLSLVEMRIEDRDLSELAKNAPHLAEANLKDSFGFSMEALREALQEWKSLKLLILTGAPLLGSDIDALRAEFPDLNLLF